MPQMPRTVLSTIAIALTATPILAQQQGQRLAPECRAEIVQLCAQDGERDRAKIRACAREKFDQLSTSCSAEIQQRLQTQRGASANTRNGSVQGSAASMSPSATITYGDHQRQQVDYFAPADSSAGAPPLVLFIHGGGWAFGQHTRVHQKPAHFTSAGYAFASGGYRVLPDAPVEDQAKDVATALKAIRAEADTLGFDPQNIVLMGHSAGAHLAALVSTDPKYADEDMAAIKGVILLDGAGYDVEARMSRTGAQASRFYDDAFGSDPARQRALSPITHVGGADAPNWAILYVEQREVSRSQSQALSEKLIAAGTNAKAIPIADSDHGRLNREIGTEAGAQQTEAIDAFLARIFG